LIVVPWHAAAQRPYPPRSHENHEARISDLRWPEGRAIRTIDPEVRCSTPDPRTASKLLRRNAMWTKPEFTEMRFGFEVTMYIYNR
jgi:coenzyme PQQ precursor peptide PqqA